MSRFQGAMTGLVGAPLAVVAFGAVVGFINGWAPCNGTPYTAYGAGFGALYFGYFFSLPAAILGLAFGAASVGGGRALNISLLMSVIVAVALALALRLTITVGG